MDIFRTSNRLFDSVSDAESHDIKSINFLCKTMFAAGGRSMTRAQKSQLEPAGCQFHPCQAV